MVVSILSTFIFFFNDTATTEIYTLSLHDALPIWLRGGRGRPGRRRPGGHRLQRRERLLRAGAVRRVRRSEEHTSELQSRQYLVCRLLLEKKYIHSTILLIFFYTSQCLILSMLYIL